MPTIRLTAYMRDDDGHGWSEQHDIDGGVSVTTLTPYINAFDTLMKTFRRPLLGKDGFYIGCRAAYKTANGRVAAVPLFADAPLQGTQTVGGKEVPMNDAGNALKIRFLNAASTAGSDVYLRGIWDHVIYAGQVYFGEAQGEAFKRNLDAYTNELMQKGYGWQGVNPDTTPRGNVTGYTANEDGTVDITVAVTNGVAMPASGSRVQVKFARINHSQSVLNRTLVCVVTNATTLKAVGPIAASLFSSPGTFSIPVRGFIPYALVAYFKVSRRKTGRPFGVAPGRLAAATLH